MAGPVKEQLLCCGMVVLALVLCRAGGSEECACGGREETLVYV